MKKKQEAACADSDCRLGRDLYYCEKKADSQKDSRVYDEGSKMYSGRAGGSCAGKGKPYVLGPETGLWIRFSERGTNALNLKSL